jgi:hypothetical protein
MNYMELTLNNWDKHSLEPITVSDPQEIRQCLGLRPREELEGYAFTTEVNEGRGLAITTKGRCIPVPAGYFVCREEVDATDL